ncbi:MAG: hypothetical protein ACO3PN_08905, partial [Chthoniobacterales bacterium]
GSGGGAPFAELCGALVLAGELSIIGALAAGEFTRAHEKLARGRPPRRTETARGLAEGKRRELAVGGCRSACGS